MSQAFQFGYGSPSTFSDWANYAGLDRRTGMMRSEPVSPTGETMQAMPDIPDEDMSVSPVTPPSITSIPPMGKPAGVMPTSSMGGTTSSLGYVMKHFGD